MSKEMQEAKKRRAAAKGWVTRSVKELQDLFDDDTTSFELLDAAVSVFDHRLAAFDEQQTAVELLLEDDTDLEADMDETDEFHKYARKIRAEATKRLKGARDGSDNASTSTKERSEVKLPRLELPKYTGELTDWQSFWDRFEALVDQSELPVISKFSYLQSLLEGEALSVIQGLSLTSANYKVACDLLKERFGRTERIIFAHVQGLLNVTLTPRGKGANQCDSLWKLQDQLLRHVRSLEGLGINGDQYGVVLTPVILSRLPQDIRLEWSRESSGHEGDLEWLLKFLQTEIQRRERSETFKDLYVEKINIRPDVERKTVSSASALQTSAEEGPPQCAFCQKRHKTEKCWQILKLNIHDREEKTKQAELCFKCLLKGHVSRGCKGKVKCTLCNGHHNVLFCRVGKPYSDNNNLPGKQVVTHKSNGQVNIQSSDAANTSTVEHVGISHDKRVKKSTVLQTAKVKVLSKGGKSVEANVMFDLGADTTYVSHDFVKRIKPKWITSKYTSYSAFGNKKSQGSQERNVYDVKLIDREGNNHSVFAVEVTTICPPLSRQRVPYDVLRSLSHLQLADDYGHDRDLTLDILVGVDNYWRFVSADNVVRFDDLVAHESKFGWILSGSCLKAHEESVSHQLLCISTTSHVTESELHNFWNLESIGIYAQKDGPPKDPVLDTFEETVKYVNGRYEVALPWKSKDARLSLLDNEKCARKRLSVLNYKFEKNPDLKEEYDKVLKGYEDDNIIVEVPLSERKSPYPTFYLPHRPVIRDSISSKVRPVFDASAAGPNGVSLNDCLESGPSLIPDLVEILLRFRRWNIALTADITKAFLQIGVQPSDQDVHRFLWQCGDMVRAMKFVRVPFGNTSSPFLLNATLKHHLNSYPVSITVQELQENLYVDDWLSGADTVEEASKMFNEAQNILLDAGMTLSKWHSNNDFLINQHHQYFEPQVEQVMRLLGMFWNSSMDVFSFKGLNLKNDFDLIFTKRNVLSLIARLFDPLGLISPFIMYAKILFQEIWRLGLCWDEALPHDLQLRFQSWISSIELIKNFEINRCYFPGLSLTSVEGLEVHAFSDASEKGYGSCMYFRVPKSDEEFHISFVMSRTKVAPIKRVTLPRLELLGALLSARLMHFVKSALHLDDCVRLVYWTDSKVALSWIKGNPTKWKMFVANRVTEIQTLSSPSNWFHCPGKDNPADLMTRGVLADHLMSNDLWLKGPSWLSNTSNFSTVANTEDEVYIYALPSEEYKGEAAAMIVKEEASPVFDFKRCSDFTKVMNIFAWVKRFILNCRSNTTKLSGPLTYEELSKAKENILICVQKESYEKEINALSQGKPLPKDSSLRKLNPFLDSNGLLRIKGRLQYADLSYDTKHPIIIPNCHVAKLIVQFQHKILKHAGVHTLMSTIRNSYWIIGLRQMAKRICRECVACKRFDSRPCNQPSPPLPELRVKPTFPFAITGLDYAGPLFAVDQLSKKLYILLFTCAVTRSVHLELTDSLSVPDCLLAIRRFSARRGLPSVLYSDNAKTFVSVANKLQQFFGLLSPEWKFIAPRSPWWGGWWERLVKSVKSALKKSLGTKCLTKCELETTLTEVEACVNSRPLTYVNEEPDVCDPLTPSHFLIGRVAGFQPQVSDEHVNVSGLDLSEREIVRKRQLDKFWRMWSDDYLKNLPPAVKGFRSNCNVKKGSVVLLREDNVPRMNWPLGVITDLYPGRDGIVRSVNVKTAKGMLCRPVQKIHDLEICYDVNSAEENSEVPVECPDEEVDKVDTDENDETENPEQVKVSRSGRVVKPRTVLDL
ncbi:hypothetical protein Pmani_004972 [Petrolisthes manimaculis]|uniref:Integrase catalytic domain-containing protein n=1 Tax=Petrolisthes manimaculis TaxID=1843537 RepID=A0AAE1QFR2_9EUCA|nr:hypothetical protein Pmani_004972 [Petrolisthes manimaculis]